MSVINICDLKVRSLSHSHNLNVNKRFEYFLKTLNFSIESFIREYTETNIPCNLKIVKIYNNIRIGLKNFIPFSKSTKKSKFLFFPSCDFEDLIFLFIIFLYLNITGSQKIIALRFLCIDAERWLENKFLRSFAYVIINLMKVQKHKFIFLAETPEGAEYISVKLNVLVFWLPTPIAKLSRKAVAMSKLLYLPGKPRWDKGSKELDIYASLLGNNGSEIRIIDQSGADKSVAVSENRISIDSDLNQEKYEEYLDACAWIFAPHIQNLYRIRGSALISDGIEHQKPILARKGTSLGNFVEKFRIGCTFVGKHDFIETILELEKMTSKKMFFGSFELAQDAINEATQSFFISLIKEHK